MARLPTHNFTLPTLQDGFRWRGLRVGLLGGSFNPPHAGHLHIARIAKAKFGLDFVWWIVTPQNPLKDTKGMAPYNERYQNVENMLHHMPRQMPTHLESELGTTYTFETISKLREHFPFTDFLWICGMDNALIFHKWDKWQRILETCPITFIARPPAHQLVKGCPIRMLDNISHHHQAYGRRTDLKSPGIYWLEGNKMLDISSTQIRNSEQKQ
ncbi:MAG: nicotinate (nicotinamide) nucleotide adenylyltransferase [Alphaproteobacteria bacterium]|nr:nicotinate (nicotinamide) nucleotide adenylyltransferase [Alphaproteobacteria bacterium]